jgi:P-type E1-E2 ATPase
MGVAAWVISGDPDRFLAVMVIATPCPLLIAVPVAIVGAVSLAARAGIIIKDPGVLERISTTDTMMFDKTGTLTYGRAALTEIAAAPGVDEAKILRLAGELERYSRHPLASAIVAAADARAEADAGRATVEHISERPGSGLRGTVDGRQVWITSHSHAVDGLGAAADAVPAASDGMECIVVVDGAFAATMQFRDEPRIGSTQFIHHLAPRHGIAKSMLISGDRSNEVQYLAQRVGIAEVHAGCSPEEKLRIVRDETARGRTLFLGDGINDAPAMAAADVGIAFGAVSDVTMEAAGAVVLDSSLERLDELFHISERMRRIALQSALGGIGLSLIGMGFAVIGWLPPIAGAITQEAIDILAILNAARMAVRRTPMADYERFEIPAPPAQLTAPRS